MKRYKTKNGDFVNQSELMKKAWEFMRSQADMTFKTAYSKAKDHYGIVAPKKEAPKKEAPKKEAPKISIYDKLPQNKKEVIDYIEYQTNIDLKPHLSSLISKRKDIVSFDTDKLEDRLIRTIESHGIRSKRYSIAENGYKRLAIVIPKKEEVQVKKEEVQVKKETNKQAEQMKLFGCKLSGSFGFEDIGDAKRRGDKTFVTLDWLKCVAFTSDAKLKKSKVHGAKIVFDSGKTYTKQEIINSIKSLNYPKTDLKQI